MEPVRALILGFPRSGTTLLARLLDAHPEIGCPPETHLFTAAARFLSEQSEVEGPPIGVLSGLGFLDVPAADVMDALRDTVFALQDRVCGNARVRVEKTGVDVFHLEALEPFLAGHARFVCLTRNPLDVIASNMDLAGVMGAQLSDLRAATRAWDSPHMGLAHAWAERQEALDAFAVRNPEACHSLRYEDLLDAPEETLGALFEFLGTDGDASDVLARAFEGGGGGPVGLGDFRIHETSGIRPHDPNGWRKRLPRAAASRLLPVVAPLMERHGYKVPRMPKVPDRETAIRQFRMAAEMRRSAAGGEAG